MTFTLDEVIKGLMDGKAFELRCKDGSMEYLSPAGENQFCHEVTGTACGGWGGSNTMKIYDLIRLKRRWPSSGWKRQTK